MFFELEGETGKKKRGRPKKNIDTFEKFFDICSCTHMSRELCDCSVSEKVPDREFCFLIDQRTERKMYIADIDKKVTKVWMERNERKQKRENYEKRHKLCLDSIEEDIIHPEDDPEII